MQAPTLPLQTAGENLLVIKVSGFGVHPGFRVEGLEFIQDCGFMLEFLDWISDVVAWFGAALGVYLSRSIHV